MYPANMPMAMRRVRDPNFPDRTPYGRTAAGSPSRAKIAAGVPPAPDPKLDDTKADSADEQYLKTERVPRSTHMSASSSPTTTSGHSGSLVAIPAVPRLVLHPDGDSSPQQLSSAYSNVAQLPTGHTNAMNPVNRDREEQLRVFENAYRSKQHMKQWSKSPNAKEGLSSPVAAVRDASDVTLRRTANHLSDMLKPYEDGLSKSKSLFLSKDRDLEIGKQIALIMDAVHYVRTELEESLISRVSEMRRCLGAEDYHKCAAALDAMNVDLEAPVFDLFNLLTAMEELAVSLDIDARCLAIRRLAQNAKMSPTLFGNLGSDEDSSDGEAEGLATDAKGSESLRTAVSDGNALHAKRSPGRDPTGRVPNNTTLSVNDIASVVPTSREGSQRGGGRPLKKKRASMYKSAEDAYMEQVRQRLIREKVESQADLFKARRRIMVLEQDVAHFHSLTSMVRSREWRLMTRCSVLVMKNSLLEHRLYTAKQELDAIQVGFRAFHEYKVKLLSLIKTVRHSNPEIEAAMVIYEQSKFPSLNKICDTLPLEDVVAAWVHAKSLESAIVSRLATRELCQREAEDLKLQMINDQNNAHIQTGIDLLDVYAWEMIQGRSRQELGVQTIPQMETGFFMSRTVEAKPRVAHVECGQDDGEEDAADALLGEELSEFAEDDLGEHSASGRVSPVSLPSLDKNTSRSSSLHSLSCRSLSVALLSQTGGVITSSTVAKHSMATTTTASQTDVCNSVDDILPSASQNPFPIANPIPMGSPRPLLENEVRADASTMCNLHAVSSSDKGIQSEVVEQPPIPTRPRTHSISTEISADILGAEEFVQPVLGLGITGPFAEKGFGVRPLDPGSSPSSRPSSRGSSKGSPFVSKSGSQNASLPWPRMHSRTNSRPLGDDGGSRKHLLSHSNTAAILGPSRSKAGAAFPPGGIEGIDDDSSSIAVRPASHSGTRRTSMSTAMRSPNTSRNSIPSASRPQTATMPQTHFVQPDDRSPKHSDTLSSRDSLSADTEEHGDTRRPSARRASSVVSEGMNTDLPAYLVHSTSTSSLRQYFAVNASVGSDEPDSPGPEHIPLKVSVGFESKPRQLAPPEAPPLKRKSVDVFLQTEEAFMEKTRSGILSEKVRLLQEERDALLRRSDELSQTIAALTAAANAKQVRSLPNAASAAHSVAGTASSASTFFVKDLSPELNNLLEETAMEERRLKQENDVLRSGYMEVLRAYDLLRGQVDSIMQYAAQLDRREEPSEMSDAISEESVDSSLPEFVIMSKKRADPGVLVKPGKLSYAPDALGDTYTPQQLVGGLQAFSLGPGKSSARSQLSVKEETDDSLIDDLLKEQQYRHQVETVHGRSALDVPAVPSDEDDRDDAASLTGSHTRTSATGSSSSHISPGVISYISPNTTKRWVKDVSPVSVSEQHNLVYQGVQDREHPSTAASPMLVTHACLPSAASSTASTSADPHPHAAAPPASQVSKKTIDLSSITDRNLSIMMARKKRRAMVRFAVPEVGQELPALAAASNSLQGGAVRRQTSKPTPKRAGQRGFGGFEESADERSAETGSATDKWSSFDFDELADFVQSLHTLEAGEHADGQQLSPANAVSASGAMQVSKFPVPPFRSAFSSKSQSVSHDVEESLFVPASHRSFVESDVQPSVVGDAPTAMSQNVGHRVQNQFVVRASGLNVYGPVVHIRRFKIVSRPEKNEDGMVYVRSRS
eukprot:ANDGO_04076.mRNA.1 hypothetical protein